jgi:hypothetical protein
VRLQQLITASGFVKGSLSVAQNDLVENSVSATGTLAGGNSVQVTDAAGNVGTAAAPASTTYLYLSQSPTSAGTYLTGHGVPSLAVNGNSVSTTTVTLPPGLMGTYYIVACANGNNQVTESNTTNTAQEHPSRSLINVRFAAQSQAIGDGGLFFSSQEFRFRCCLELITLHSKRSGNLQRRQLCFLHISQKGTAGQPSLSSLRHFPASAWALLHHGDPV